MVFELPKLGYDYDALEPYIDGKTMEIHHTKHHQGYVDKLNKALEGTEWYNKEIEEVLQNLDKIPEDIRKAVRNNGGGHYNHSQFWEILKKNEGKTPEGKLKEMIEAKFGSFENFKKEFIEAGMSVFGSGWVWLILEDQELKIVTTPNQDNPIMEGKKVVFGVDVWEHAYYLKYQWRRKEYLENIFYVLNWDKIEERLLNLLN